MSLDRETLKAIWKVVSEIPPGYVLAYGEVATLAGYPKGARMVSRALGAAPKAMRLPWHRVINAQGKIAFPKDSAGWKKQRDLLEREGIQFLKGRVDLQRYGWKGVVDQLIWGDEMPLA